MEWFNSLFSPFKDRLKSQVYSAIFFSWIICNWHIVVAMFTDSKYFGYDAQNKILYIKNQFEICTYWLNLIVLPASYTLIYIYILPHIDRSIFRYKDEIERKKLKDKLNLIESIGYSTNEYLNLHKVYEKVKNEIKSATETLRAKDNELTQNMGQINQLKDNIENQEKAIKDLNSKLKIYTSRDKANEVLFGEWRIVFHQKENNIILDTLRVVFETDKISKLETTTSSNEIARIIMFDYNPQFNRIKIVLEELKFTGYNFSYLLLTIDNFTFQTQKTKGVLNFLNSNQNIGNEIILERVI
jgi:hypothetical protein